MSRRRPASGTPGNTRTVSQSPINRLTVNRSPFNRSPFNKSNFNKSHFNKSHFNKSHFNRKKGRKTSRAVKAPVQTWSGGRPRATDLERWVCTRPTSSIA